MGRTEELGVPKTDELADGAPESLDGLGESNLNVIDTTKEPKLTISE